MNFKHILIFTIAIISSFQVAAWGNPFFKPYSHNGHHWPEVQDYLASNQQVKIIREVSQQIDARRNWQPSIDLNPGDSVRISASGHWNTNPDSYASHGPEGPRNGYTASGHYALPGAKEGSLIARIGNGRPFVVNRSTSFTANKSGTLLFVINDDIYQRNGAGLLDNKGAVEARIEVTRLSNRPRNHYR